MTTPKEAASIEECVCMPGAPGSWLVWHQRVLVQQQCVVAEHQFGRYGTAAVDVQQQHRGECGHALWVQDACVTFCQTLAARQPAHMPGMSSSSRSDWRSPIRIFSCFTLLLLLSLHCCFRLWLQQDQQQLHRLPQGLLQHRACQLHWCSGSGRPAHSTPLPGLSSQHHHC
jgi:hypothetical protein